MAMLSDYKVGQTLRTGNSAFYAKVTEVQSDGDIKIRLYMPSGGTKFYNIGGGWTTLPSGGVITLTKNVTLSMRVQKKTYDTVWDGFRWYGNIRKNGSSNPKNWHMVYGSMTKRFNYKSSDAPHWQGASTFIKDCGRSSSEWEYVSGTFKWNNSINSGNWSGWIKGDYKGQTENDYARPVTGKLKKKNPTIKNTDASVRITRIKVIDPTPADIVIVDANRKNKKIPPNPSEYTVATPIKVYWKEDTSKFSYSRTGMTYTDIDGNRENIDIVRNQVLKNYGTYTLTVTETNKTSGDRDTYSVTMNIFDPVPPAAIHWYERDNKSLKYDDTFKVYIDTRHPTFDVPSGCDIVTSEMNGESFSRGSDVFENGRYVLKAVVRKRSNNMESAANGSFIIDNVPPEPPIIRIGNNVDYQGRDFGLVEQRFPNPVSITIAVQEGCSVVERELYYKKSLWDTAWTRIDWKDPVTEKGIYRVTAKSRKLSNGLVSQATTVEFYKKIRWRYTITLNPNDLCYRTIATVNFPEDPLRKFQYKIDDGEWKWYRDPVKIYDNCIMYVRSLDADDDYESEITAKIIDIIDKEPPLEPKIGGVSDGDIKQSPVIPTLIG
jgi:hypothetical protein